MRFRSTRPRLAAVALLTTAVLPISGPSGTAGPTPEPPGTQSVRIPLRDAARDRTAVREIHSEKPFDLVGLTWEGQPPDRIEVRVRTDEGWGRWTPLEAEDGGSEPMWTGRSNDAQVRASSQGEDVTYQLQFIGIDTVAQVTPPQIAPRG